MKYRVAKGHFIMAVITQSNEDISPVDPYSWIFAGDTVRTPEGNEGQVIYKESRYHRWYGGEIMYYVVGWNEDKWFGSWSGWYTTKQLVIIE
jgi:hypothetical protein